MNHHFSFDTIQLILNFFNQNVRHVPLHCVFSDPARTTPFNTTSVVFDDTAVLGLHVRLQDTNRNPF